MVGVLFVGLGFVPMGADSGAPGMMLALTWAGTVLTFVGLMVQFFRAERGLVLSAVGMAVVGSAALFSFPLMYLVVCFQAYFISSHLRVRRRLWLGLLVAGSFAALAWFVLANFVIFKTVMIDPPPGWDWAIFAEPEFRVVAGFITLLVLVSVAMMWLWGKGQLRKQLELEMWSARAELAAVSERNRIAREMHDIVAHSLSGIIAQADGGRYAGPAEPEKAVAALTTIAASGRDALAQMRGLLSTLHDGLPRERGAAPGVASLPDLISDAQRNGIDVTLQTHGETPQLDEARGLTIYRIVQECLTNILKHAGAVEAQVVVHNLVDVVEIQVDNAPGDAQLAGSGRGLNGIRERTRIYGGAVRWGSSAVYDGGWNVTATVPCGSGS